MTNHLICKTAWLTGAFLAASIVGYLNVQAGWIGIGNSQTSSLQSTNSTDSTNSTANPVIQHETDQQEPNETESTRKGESKPKHASHDFAHHQVAKQDCKTCHQVADANPLGSSPHFIDFAMKSVASDKHVDTSFLGIHASDVQTPLRKHLKLNSGVGAIVEKVIDESPAYHCGIELHDVVTSIDQKPVLGEKSLLHQVRSKSPGTKILVQFIRAGQKKSCVVVLGKQRTAKILDSYRIKGCPAQLNASTNCKDCHTAVAR